MFIETESTTYGHAPRGPLTFPRHGLEVPHAPDHFTTTSLPTSIHLSLYLSSHTRRPTRMNPPPIPILKEPGTPTGRPLTRGEYGRLWAHRYRVDPGVVLFAVADPDRPGRADLYHVHADGGGTHAGLPQVCTEDSTPHQE